GSRVPEWLMAYGVVSDRLQLVPDPLAGFGYLRPAPHSARERCGGFRSYGRGFAEVAYYSRLSAAEFRLQQSKKTISLFPSHSSGSRLKKARVRYTRGSTERGQRAN